MIRFGWKRKALELEAKNSALKLEQIALRNQIDYLIRTIRDTDDKIFSMGQCTSWESMRPRFNILHDEMTARKVVESHRIGALITNELHDTYKPESEALKKITKGK